MCFGSSDSVRTELSQHCSRFRKAGYQAIDRICDYYASLQERPVVSQVQPGYLLNTLPCEFVAYLALVTTCSSYAASAPERGEQFDSIADDFHKLILPGKTRRIAVHSLVLHVFVSAGITHWQHPNFFAYFPTASTFEGLLGDLYSSSVANPTFSVSSLMVNYSGVDLRSLSTQWLASPACTELEQVVMDWSAKLFGLGDHFQNHSGVGGGVIQVNLFPACRWRSTE